MPLGARPLDMVLNFNAANDGPSTRWKGPPNWSSAGCIDGSISPPLKAISEVNLRVELVA